MHPFKTEQAAWLYLARRWDKPLLAGPEGSGASVVIAGWCFGLCGSITGLRIKGYITDAMRQAMQMRLECAKPRIKPSNPGPYWWRCNKTGARSRAAFCRRMAMAKLCTKKPKKQRAS